MREVSSGRDPAPLNPPLPSTRPLQGSCDIWRIGGARAALAPPLQVPVTRLRSDLSQAKIISPARLLQKPLFSTSSSYNSVLARTTVRLPTIPFCLDHASECPLVPEVATNRLTCHDHATIAASLATAFPQIHNRRQPSACRPTSKSDA